MKKIQLLLIICFAIVMFLPKLSAQAPSNNDEMLDSLSFDLDELKEEKAPYFGIGGGFIGSVGFLDYNKINDKIEQSLSLDKLSGPIFLTGGQAFTAIGIIPNLRVGFISLGGSKESKKDNLDIGNNISVNRNFKYSVNYTGFSLDYAILQLKPIVVLFGANFGWGSLKMESYQTRGDYDWVSMDTQNDENFYFQEAEAVFSFVQPNLSFEWAFSPFTCLRANFAYNYSFAFSGDWEWKMNRTAKMVNVPTDINASGFSAHIGLFVGIFTPGLF